jgi:hypothetical protein
MTMLPVLLPLRLPLRLSLWLPEPLRRVLLPLLLLLTLPLRLSLLAALVPGAPAFSAASSAKVLALQPILTA